MARAWRSLVAAAAAAAMVAGASAQRARVTWFALPACNAGSANASFTVVDFSQDALCNYVPGAQEQGYKVTCGEEGSNTGTISFCSSTTCEDGTCDVVTPFNNAGGALECLPNPAEFGSLSANIECFYDNGTAIPDDIDGGDGRAVIAWFGGEEECSEPVTLVSTPLNQCNLVPNSPQTGYLAQCTSATEGSISFCDSPTCDNCTVVSPVANDAVDSLTCMTNDVSTGSRWWTLQCGEGAGGAPGGGNGGGGNGGNGGGGNGGAGGSSGAAGTTVALGAATLLAAAAGRMLA